MDIRVGKYRTRDGRIAVVKHRLDNAAAVWPIRGNVEDSGQCWRADGSWEVTSGVECAPRTMYARPYFEALVGAPGVSFEPVDYRPEDISATIIAPPGPTIRDVIEHERAETAAFASATEDANRHAFAALRSLTRALNRHGIAPGSEVADAHAFALLVIDGFDS